MGYRQCLQGFLKKFDAVIANVNLPEDVPAFVPLAKGKQVAVLSVQDKKRVSGRDILFDCSGKFVPTAVAIRYFYSVFKVL